jgi:hypothetical protein
MNEIEKEIAKRLSTKEGKELLSQSIRNEVEKEMFVNRPELPGLDQSKERKE